MEASVTDASQLEEIASPKSTSPSKKEKIQSHKLLVESPKKKAVEKRVDEITAQINEIRKKRLEMSGVKEEKPGTPKRDITKIPKRVFHHPNLDFIIGEVVYSPYMTNPLDRYPSQTFTVVEEVRKYKQKGLKYQDIPKEKVPFDIKLSRSTFRREVLDFRPSFTSLHQTPKVR
jgi:hypothetical protein